MLLSHDGWKYKTAKERDAADKAHKKKHPTRGGRSNNAHTTKWDSQKSDRWDGWYDFTKHNPAATGNGAASADPDSSPPADNTAGTGDNDITKRFECGRFATDSQPEGHFAGLTFQHCKTDWYYKEIFNRLCSQCDKQFPEQLLSNRIRNNPIGPGEIDPKSATGICAFGNTTTAVAATAVALVVSITMVESLPANGTAPANGKASAKTPLR